MRKTINLPLTPASREEYQRNAAEARQGADAEAFDAAWVEGSALTLEQAIELTLE